MSEEVSWAEQVAAALRERMQIIGDEESRKKTEQHTARLKRNSEQLEKLRNDPGARDHPRLGHYLAQGSYTKALEHLELNMAG